VLKVNRRKKIIHLPHSDVDNTMKKSFVKSWQPTVSRNSLHFMEPKSWLSYSQEGATGSCPVPP